MSWAYERGAVVMPPSPSPFAFGGRSASPFPAPSFGFGAASRDAGPVKPATPPPASRRRRRESTPLDDEAAERAGEAMDVVGALTNKRARREVKGLRGPSAGQRASPEAVADVDLGKALASLPKESLLTILTTVVAQQPALKPIIQSLIPPPSLDAFSAELAQLEKRVLDSVPRGLNLRDEYVWNRVRAPLDDYVTENRTFLNSFVPSQAGNMDDGNPPSIIFAFLASLTASYLRIESVLPRSAMAASPSVYRVNAGDPLSSHLLPALFNAWHTFATRLAYSINSQGRILSAETVRSWFRTLDEMATGGHVDSTARRACETVRDRLVKEVGWTIGMRPRAMSSGSLRDDAMFQDDEEL